jgi:hypothetical protein
MSPIAARFARVEVAVQQVSAAGFCAEIRSGVPPVDRTLASHWDKLSVLWMSDRSSGCSGLGDSRNLSLPRQITGMNIAPTSEIEPLTPPE